MPDPLEASPSDLNESDCPARIRNIVSDLFALTVTHGHRIDTATAEQALSGARQRLGDICLECLAGTTEQPATPAPAQTTVTPQAGKKDHRKYFLLRMLSCKLSHLFDTRNNPAPLNRACSHGIDTYIRRLFSKAVYQQVNSRAGEILKQCGTGDTRILNTILDNPDYKAFLENALVRIAVSFIKYQGARDLFISDLNMAMPRDVAPLTQQDFRAIIGALLSDIFLLGKSMGGNDLLDYRYGANTSLILDQVAGAFSKDF